MFLVVKERLEGPKYNIDFGRRVGEDRGRDRYVHCSKGGHCPSL